MIVHYYECECCGITKQIVYTGYTNEHVDRLPDGWLLVTKHRLCYSYCSEECMKKGARP
jgi:hypothetical protein